MDESAISFTDEDAERIHHPHDDAIVITLLIADYTTRRVLIDNGSSADILYYPALPTNETWARSTSSSLFTIDRVLRNEGAARGHHYITGSGRVIPTANN